MCVTVLDRTSPAVFKVLWLEAGQGLVWKKMNQPSMMKSDNTSKGTKPFRTLESAIRGVNNKNLDDLPHLDKVVPTCRWDSNLKIYVINSYARVENFFSQLTLKYCPKAHFLRCVLIFLAVAGQLKRGPCH